LNIDDDMHMIFFILTHVYVFRFKSDDA